MFGCAGEGEEGGEGEVGEDLVLEFCWEGREGRHCGGLLGWW